MQTFTLFPGIAMHSDPWPATPDLRFLDLFLDRSQLPPDDFDREKWIDAMGEYTPGNSCPLFEPAWFLRFFAWRWKNLDTGDCTLIPDRIEVNGNSFWAEIYNRPGDGNPPWVWWEHYKMVPIYYASYIRPWTVQEIPWNDLRVHVKRVLEIPADESPFGRLYSAHVKVEARTVSNIAFEARFNKIPGYTQVDMYPDDVRPCPQADLTTMFPRSFQSRSVSGLVPVIFGYLGYFEYDQWNGTLKLHGIADIYHPGQTFRVYAEIGRSVGYLRDLIPRLIIGYIFNDASTNTALINGLEEARWSTHSACPPSWLAGSGGLTNIGTSQLDYTIHPAPAPYYVLGHLIDCGSFVEFVEAYSNEDMRLSEPIERIISQHGTQFFILGSYFESIVLYRGSDWTASRDNALLDLYFRYFWNEPFWMGTLSADKRWIPWLGYLDIWRYDNPYLSSFPTIYPKPPAIRLFGTYGVAQSTGLGTASFNFGTFLYFRLVGGNWVPTIGTRSGELKMIFPLIGWRRQLPAGRVEHIPSYYQSIARYGSARHLDNEVMVMRKVITIGNNKVTLFPRAAVFFGNRVVPYFTQDGGKCPLWMGEPILGIDAVPLDTGKLVVYLFTTRGAISFKLTVDGVEDQSWEFSPVPEWFRRWLGLIT